MKLKNTHKGYNVLIIISGEGLMAIPDSKLHDSDISVIHTALYGYVNYLLVEAITDNSKSYFGEMLSRSTKFDNSFGLKAVFQTNGESVIFDWNVTCNFVFPLLYRVCEIDKENKFTNDAIMEFKGHDVYDKMEKFIHAHSFNLTLDMFANNDGSDYPHFSGTMTSLNTTGKYWEESEPFAFENVAGNNSLYEKLMAACRFAYFARKFFPEFHKFEK